MRDFVSYPTAGNERLHCTMKRTEDNPEIGSPCYTLYLEYLGGLVPILKGRRISKLRPEFVIMDPKTDGKTGKQKQKQTKKTLCLFRTLFFFFLALLELVLGKCLVTRRRLGLC